MVMKKSTVVELASDLLIPGWKTERAALDHIDKWLRWEPQALSDKIPNHATNEHKNLARIAETPMLSLVVTTVAQQLAVEGVRSERGEDAAAAILKPWLRNRMRSRQRAIYRAALGYGYSYASAMPGDSGAVLRGRSPRDTYAVYQDVVDDEYPMYYLSVSGNHFHVVDEDTKYTLSLERDSRGLEKLVYVTEERHNVGVAPLVRYSNQIDIEGRTPGEVEPYIQVAARIDKDTYDRLLIQHSNSWKVRYATNLDKPADEAEAERVKIMLRQSDLLTGEGDVKFGTLDETVPDGMIKATDKDIEMLAVVSQTPVHALTGNLVNLSADAIAEARSMADLKVHERKIGFGDSDEQLLRLAAHIEGRREDAEDFTMQMSWSDMGSRSMTQAADSLGKLATMLKIPVELLWDRIPNVTPEIARSWVKYAQENPSAEQQLADALNKQANGEVG